MELRVIYLAINILMFFVVLGGVPLMGKGVALDDLGPRSFCKPGHTARPPGRVNSSMQVKLVRDAMAYAQPGWPELKALIVTTFDEHQVRLSALGSIGQSMISSLFLITISYSVIT